MAQNAIMLFVNIRNAVSEGLTLCNYSQESVRNGVCGIVIENINGNNYKSLDNTQ